MTARDWIDGSSPRLRGTRASKRESRAALWFIPAPAGNAPEAVLCLHQRSVHPRACGERYQRLSPYLHDYGSSPRLRGTRMSVGYDQDGNRFIPAPAGNASR